MVYVCFLGTTSHESSLGVENERLLLLETFFNDREISRNEEVAVKKRRFSALGDGNRGKYKREIEQFV